VARLFEHFWTALGEARPVDPAVIRTLEDHAWPGNVRELENLVERLSVISEGPVIRVSDLPPHLRALSGGEPAPARAAEQAPEAAPEARPSFLAEVRAGPVELDAARPVDLPAMLRRLEDSYIDAALAKTGGNRKAAADLLGLQRTTLVEKLRRRSREASIA
jgi:sigma-54 specific flagellar transcriptional regulator A